MRTSVSQVKRMKQGEKQGVRESEVGRGWEGEGEIGEGGGNSNSEFSPKKRDNLGSLWDWDETIPVFLYTCQGLRDT